MKWENFLKITGNLPVIETELLLTGVSEPDAINVQISRWTRTGKLIKVKRGVYLLSQEYRKVDVYEPYLAVLLKTPFAFCFGPLFSLAFAFKRKAI